MVGFGSSLRMGRRTGWDSAYLDYETLKLLLSQIEAVYEESEQHQRGGALGPSGSSDGFFVNTGGGGIFDSERNSNNNASNNPETKDYRDELFLEPDSDIAFASELDLGDYDDDDDDDDSDDDDSEDDDSEDDDSYYVNFMKHRALK